MQKPIKLLRSRGKRRSNKHAGTVDVNISKTVVAQQRARYATSLENPITLRMYVEVVRRNLRKKPVSRKLKPKTVRSLQQNDNQHSDPDSHESYLYTVNNPNKNNANVKVTIAAVSLTTMVDTGASINVIDKQTFSKFREVTLQPTKTRAFAYNQSEPVNFLGKFDAVVETRKRMTVATVYVVQGRNSGNLLSLSTAQDLGLITLHLNPVSTKDAALDKIIAKHQ